MLFLDNTKGKTDAAIYASPDSIHSNIWVLIEAKGPERPDMAKRTELNCKALHELILYYIREEEYSHNTEVKHLIITNCLEWFVFDKTCFYRLFLANKKFAKEVIDADRENTTDYVYGQVIRKKVEDIMGVEEVTDDNVKKIKRLKANRQSYSLVEQTISQLDGYGIYNEQDLFDAALGLVLNWVNRLLFLKLLESQLLSLPLP